MPVAHDRRQDVVAHACAIVLGDEVEDVACLDPRAVGQTEQLQPRVVDEHDPTVEVREADEVAGVADDGRQLLEAAGRAAALGHVPMDAQVAANAARVVAHGRDDDLDLDRRAVLTHRCQLESRPATLEELVLEPLALVVAGEGRDLVGRPADDLGRGVAVQPLGAEVPLGDAEVRVGAHDAVVDHVE